MQTHDEHDEYLEALYHVRERSHFDLPFLVEHYNDLHGGKDNEREFDPAVLRQLESSQLVVVANEVVKLTEAGVQKAERIVRRHRLAERLLTDVLHMSNEDAEGPACEFEHLLAEEITEGICILLGHPRLCPHGSAIPMGACCRAGAKESVTAVVPLPEVAIGATVRVAYVNSLSDAQQHQLTHFDIVPGTVIRLHQLKPAVVIARDERMVAMERAVAQNIFVWRNWHEVSSDAAPAIAKRPGLWQRVTGLFG